MQIKLELLGQFRVTIGDFVIAAGAWRRDRGAALVKLLAVTPGHRLHRDQVLELFWPELDRDAAGANLRKAVHFARRALGVHEVIESGETIAFASCEVVVDTLAFETSAKVALQSSDPAACANAADLYRGELLPDDRYCEWLEEPRKRLQERYVRLLRAGKLWDRLIAIDPTDEQAQCALMQAALDAGRRGEVIRLFRELRERLRLDLGVGPSKAAVELYDRALTTKAIEPVSITDRLRAALAWGLIALHSGDHAKAESVAREARELAFGAGLGREMGEATALLGMVAHVQGRWCALFREEVVEWVGRAPELSSNVYDGHLCLAQYCLASPNGHEQIRDVANELLSVAERASSIPGRGLATLFLGELALSAGQLDEAGQLLLQAERHFVDASAVAGEVLVLEHLAHLARARGEPQRARDLVGRAAGIARTTWLLPHLGVRVSALQVQTSETRDETLQRVRDGDRELASGTVCQPCSMRYRTASAIALAEAGALRDVSRRLDEAERLAGMWNGGPWFAAIWEARGVLRRAEGDAERAVAGFGEAAARYAELGRAFDQARCLARMNAPARASTAS